jgi:glycosyltransferase involved in cell wall biosynthesis
MINVLLDGKIYEMQSYGGINRCFNELLTRLVQQEADIQVVVYSPRRTITTVPNNPGITVVRECSLRPARVFGRFAKQIDLARLRAGRPHIFHSTYYDQPYWNGLKQLVTVHDFVDENTFDTMSGNGAAFSETKRKTIERADAIIAVSYATKADILKYTDASADRISVIYHGISATFSNVKFTQAEIGGFHSRHNINGPYWLFVGRRQLYKNFGTLLRAWARTRMTCDTYLVAIGPDEGLESWQIDFVIENRLENRLVLLCGADDRELGLAYSGAVGFIFPSLSEGFGIPLLEAMACGAPIIASDIPVFHEVASDAALFFDPHDDQQLASLMLEMSDDTSLRERLRDAGYTRVPLFSWSKSAHDLAQVYRSLV